MPCLERHGQRGGLFPAIGQCRTVQNNSSIMADFAIALAGYSTVDETLKCGEVVSAKLPLPFSHLLMTPAVRHIENGRIEM